MPVAYVVAACLVLSGALCWATARFAPRFLRGRIGGIEPGTDRRPPRLGGIVACAATLAVASAVGYGVPAHWLGLLPCIAAMYALGLLDDVFDLPPRVKFLGQAVICLAATATVSFNPIATPDGLGLDLGFLAVPWTAFWLLLVVNAFNLTDGADGLAGGLVVVIASAIALLARSRGNVDEAVLLAVFAGAHAGFLIVNWAPARLYLGDAGSLGAGFVLAVAGIQGTNVPGATVGLHTNVLLFWLPLIEMALTVGRRFVRGQPLARGDDRHIHHMLMATGRPTGPAVAVLLGLATLTAVAAVASMEWRSAPVALLIVALVGTTLIGIQALGYVEFRVVVDRALRFARMSRRRGRVLVSVAEVAHRIRGASSWVELRAALGSLEEHGVLEAADVVPREARPGTHSAHAWTFEGDLGPSERPGYTLVVRSGEDDRFAIRSDDVRTYLLPALESAIARLGNPVAALAKERSR